MKQVLIISLFYLLSSGFYSWADETNLPTIDNKTFEVNPYHDQTFLLGLILKDLKLQCMEFKLEMGDSDTRISNKLGINLDENIFDILLTADGKKGSILYASFTCGQAHMCGSGGCPIYLFVNGRIFETFGHLPFSITQNKQTFIILPKHGGTCNLSDDSDVYGSDGCYGVAVWDERKSACRSLGKQLPLSKISPN